MVLVLALKNDRSSGRAGWRCTTFCELFKGRIGYRVNCWGVWKNNTGIFPKYGDKSEALAGIAAKNHKNGVSNPYAQIRKDLGFDFCNTVSEKSIVASPLKRTDCSCF